MRYVGFCLTLLIVLIIYFYIFFFLTQKESAENNQIFRIFYKFSLIMDYRTFYKKFYLIVQLFFTLKNKTHYIFLFLLKKINFRIVIISRQNYTIVKIIEELLFSYFLFSHTGSYTSYFQEFLSYFLKNFCEYYTAFLMFNFLSNFH